LQVPTLSNGSVFDLKQVPVLFGNASPASHAATGPASPLPHPFYLRDSVHEVARVSTGLWSNSTGAFVVIVPDNWEPRFGYTLTGGNKGYFRQSLHSLPRWRRWDALSKQHPVYTPYGEE
jgi:hypothetical protein